jgi:hydrogenase maturation protein HypF
MRVGGTVQGVGFRPFVYRLAGELRLAGSVANTLAGAEIEIEGTPAQIEEFRQRLFAELPPLATIQSCEVEELPPLGAAGFSIHTSDTEGTASALVLPDIATCPDCLREVFDPADRRYRYPFTNCTNCGPRYSIIRSLPYDRPNTTMARFEMCPECRAEYENPANRRFHAQPNACPVCGPRLRLLDAAGREVATGDDALRAAVDALAGGAIVALKGIGGFQLLVDATVNDAVRGLRARKRREEKPFAVMVPAIGQARQLCRLSTMEEQLLLAPEAPIVIAQRVAQTPSQIAPAVAPDNPALGLMLPYSPLHHLLMHEFARPVVATSGNLTDEPICTSTREALERLHGVADFFLTHNRPIERYVDDSVVRMIAGRPVVLRRARGYAPLPVARLERCATGIIATGPHLKNTVAIGVDRNIVLSQHIGDLDSEPAIRAHEKTAAALLDLYGVEVSHVACDTHPDYASGRTAERLAGAGAPLLRVPHHYAHVLAAMAEHDLLREEVLGIAWDGTGYGLDGTVWGSEFLRADCRGFRRLGHLQAFRIPGGDRAMREPRRSALGVLAGLLDPTSAAQWYRAHRPQAFRAGELDVLVQMLTSGLNSPWTCGAGRLFDAVAALLGLRQTCSFEGQAAMELEWLAAGASDFAPYPLAWTVRDVPAREAWWSASQQAGAQDALSTLSVLDWSPLIRAVLDDQHAGIPPATIAARFHASLAEGIVEFARRAAIPVVVCSGGCFQNSLLTGFAVRRLEEEGFRVFIPEKVPPNDGGIAVGQVVAAACRAAEE